MRTIGIIGASGYIGRHVANLLSKDFRVTALQRNVQAVIPSLPQINIASVTDNKQTFDILINTSYNQDKDMGRVYALNNEVLQQIKAASHTSTKVIHLSSVAVFGFGLEKPVSPAPVKQQNDYGYVQSKVHMENLLLQHIPHEQLSIIRLGNVWGPANNSWTQQVANALQWGLPVLSPTPAFSNITSIHHIADYIRYIANSGDHLLFHHLAEFSAITWQQVIGELGTYLQTPPALISNIPFYARSLSEDMQHAVGTNPIATLKQLRNGRFTSHYFPQRLLRALNASRKSTYAPKQLPYEADPLFHVVLLCNTEFKLHVLPGWKASYSWQELQSQVFAWLDDAGFTAR